MNDGVLAPCINQFDHPQELNSAAACMLVPYVGVPYFASPGYDDSQASPMGLRYSQEPSRDVQWNARTGE
jgi:hypothetical protein